MARGSAALYAAPMSIRRRVVLGMALAVPMARVARAAVAHRLTILHMNDFHSRHEPVDAAALACEPGKPGCLGGAAHLATALAQARQAAEADGRGVLLLDAGDQFQGSLFYTAWHGEVELAVMHALGTEAMAVGNHEFDDGSATLARFVRAAGFPVLSANIDASADPDLSGLLRPWTLLDKDGLRIGVVGLTTTETPVGSSPGPHVRFAAPGPALAEAATAARAAGAKFVIALSHLGVDEDRALAGRVPGVDVFVGGHSHTLLSDSEPGAAGPAHQLLANGGGRALVTQAACFGRYVGRLDLDVAADGTLVAWGGDCRHVGLDLPPEPKVGAIVASYATRLDGVRRRIAGRTAAALPNDGCRIGECAFGDFVADAMLGSAHGAQVALMNAGGLRTGLPGGSVTLGDVMGALPFGNTVATLTLSGADLRAALAHGFLRAGKGAFPQVAGMRVGWRRGAAEPVLSVEVREPDGRFVPLDLARHYLVVTNDFLRRGGDGYAVLRTAAIDPYDAGPPLDETVAAALAAASPLSPRVDGRIFIP